MLDLALPAAVSNAVEDRVLRGAALFDDLRPGWLWAARPDGNFLVDVNLLDLARSDLCPAGQILGDYWNLPILVHLAPLCVDGAQPPPDVDPEEFDVMRAAARVEADERTRPYGLVAYPEEAESLRQAWVRLITNLRTAGQPEAAR